MRTSLIQARRRQIFQAMMKGMRRSQATNQKKTVTFQPTPQAPPVTQKQKRNYTGPAKGSQEAVERMKAVRAAQWAKNGLVVSNEEKDE